MPMFYLSLMDDANERSLFTERYNQYRFLCYKVAYDILHDKGLAEDAVQEAFLSVAQHRKKYLALSCRDFRRSIVIITRNKCIDMLRKDKNISKYASDDEVFINIPDDDAIVDKQILRQSDVQQVSDLLNLLDETSRQILIMKYIEGKSYKQIGEELNMAIKTVEVRIARAKKKIRDIAEKQGVDIDG